MTFCLPPSVFVLVCVYCVAPNTYNLDVSFCIFVILAYTKVTLFNIKTADLKQQNVVSYPAQYTVNKWIDWAQWMNRVCPWQENQTVMAWTSGLAGPVSGSAHSPWRAVTLLLPCKQPSLVFDSFRVQLFIVVVIVLITWQLKWQLKIEYRLVLLSDLNGKSPPPFPCTTTHQQNLHCLSMENKSPKLPVVTP